MYYLLKKVMEELFANYLEKTNCIYSSKLDDLPKYEMVLLIKARNNIIYINNLLNDTLSGQFYNCLGIIMEDKCMLNRAKKHYLTAAKKGDTNAMCNLGYYFYRIEQNHDKASIYFLMAAKKGDSVAMHYLGVCHYYEQNYSEFKKFCLMAIEKGNTDAMNDLGRYYCHVEQNYEKATKYYRMAIENGNMNSHYNFKCCVEKCHNYKSFINCHVDLIKNKNFAFVNKLNEFVDKHFNDCINFIVGNADILQEHLNILKNANIVGKNYCINCSKFAFLIKLNCSHHICFKCNKTTIKCLLCKKIDLSCH